MTGFYPKNVAKGPHHSFNKMFHAWMCVWVPPREDKKNSLELAGFEPATFCTFDLNDRPIDAKQTRYHCAITSLYCDHNNPGLFI